MCPEPIGWKYQSQADKFVTWKPGMDFITTTSTGVSDYIAEQIRKAQDELIVKGSIRFYDDYITNPYAIVKLNNEKETKKMEAKKCDRCGKLYENEFNQNDIQCLFKHEKLFREDEEKYSKEFIEERKTHVVYVKRGNGDYIDMCPDCRKAFKTWFENADKEKK